MSLNQKQIKNFVFADVTAAEAAGRPDEVCYVQTLKTFYDYLAAGSAYTVDHTTVLSTGNDENTRWIARAGLYAEIGSVNTIVCHAGSVTVHDGNVIIN